MIKNLALIVVFALAGLTASGLLADRGPGLGIENLIGLVAGAVGGLIVARALPQQEPHR